MPENVDELQRQLAELDSQIASAGSSILRNVLNDLRTKLQSRLTQATGGQSEGKVSRSSGTGPAGSLGFLAPAPLFAPRIEVPRVGVSDLKIMLP